MNGAPVTRADVPASNGVIHVIDQVLLPPEEMGNLAEVLSAQGFTQLVDLVVAAGLADTVSSGGQCFLWGVYNGGWSVFFFNGGQSKGFHWRSKGFNGVQSECFQ